MWLIIGLGNPGQEYENTRHNLGFRVVESLGRDLSLPLAKKGFLSQWAKGVWNGEAVVLAIPQTFMNRSGEALLSLMQFFKIDNRRVIVVHDDLDVPLGEIRIKEKGGDGGHKGLRSIICCTGRKEFIRLRLGISRPEMKGKEIDFVLGFFGEQELPVVEKQIEQAKEAVETIIFEGTATAMNQFNRRKKDKTLSSEEILS